jgi:nicotinamidase-related amidase
MPAKTGPDALLTPERSVLLLIDHQAFQFSNLHSHEPTLIVNNVVGLAKAAKTFKGAALLRGTAPRSEGGRYLLQGIQDVFPTQAPDQSDHSQFMGRPARRRGIEEDRAQQLVVARYGQICLAIAR